MIRVFLRAERRFTLAWVAGLGAFVMMLGAVYASFDDPADLDALLENYPEELLELFGDIGDIGTVDGFLSAELGAYMPLVVGIFAVMLMTKHLAGAEEKGELDHLLARPVTRGGYYWALLAAGAVVLVFILLGAAAGGVLGFMLADVTLRDVIGVVAALLEFLPIGLLYLAVGAWTGALFHRRGPANAVGIAAVVAFFAMDVVGRLVGSLEWVSYLTPNGYLGRSDLAGGEPGLGYLVYCAVVAAGLAIAGAMRFEAKDLYA